MLIVHAMPGAGKSYLCGLLEPGSFVDTDYIIDALNLEHDYHTPQEYDRIVAVTRSFADTAGVSVIFTNIHITPKRNEGMISFTYESDAIYNKMIDIGGRRKSLEAFDTSTWNSDTQSHISEIFDFVNQVSYNKGMTNIRLSYKLKLNEFISDILLTDARFKSKFKVL